MIRFDFYTGKKELVRTIDVDIDFIIPVYMDNRLEPLLNRENRLSLSSILCTFSKTIKGPDMTELSNTICNKEYCFISANKI